MNKYSVFSLATLVIFFVMFFILLNGVKLGALGKPYILSLFLIPLFGAIVGIKAKKGLLKWLMITLNIIAICIIGYIVLLAFSIAES